MVMGIFTKQKNTAKHRKVVNKVVLIDAEAIRSNPAQPRKTFEQKELDSLAESIKENGILQPLTVRLNKNGEYELISGERRLKASKLINMQKIPCIVMETTSKESAVFALIENLQRKDLNYFEQAQAIKDLIVEWGVSQEEAANRLGKAQSTIANKMRLLKLDEKQREKMLKSGINEHQARLLLKLPTNRDIDKATHYISTKNLNIRQTEKYIEDYLNEEVKPKKRLLPIIKDSRLFYNTINHAVETIKRSGIKASLEKVDKDEFIEYKIKIPK